jgi:HYD1 signature containing ADP-ribosyltransferase
MSGIINTALLPCKILKKLTANIPSRLYHYTTESSLLGIIESGVLHPSLDQNSRITMFGSGQYFTNIAPETIACIGTRACKLRADLTPAHKETGQISLIQLSGRIMDGAMAIERLECFIEFSVAGLNISATESPHIYLHKSETDLDISNLVLRYGKAPR